MLVLWYSFSIIGFDIHTCTASGSQFISTFIEGFGCDDIHPEHDCAQCCGLHDSCCHGHAHCTCHAGNCRYAESGNLSRNGAFSQKDCCFNHYHVLMITGSRTDNDDHHHYSECHCGHCPCLEMTASEISPVPASSFIVFGNQSGQSVPPGDFLSAFGVRRI